MYTSRTTLWEKAAIILPVGITSYLVTGGGWDYYLLGLLSAMAIDAAISIYRKRSRND